MAEEQARNGGRGAGGLFPPSAPSPHPSIPIRPPASFAVMTARGLRRRCPRCGAGGIWNSYFQMKHACPTCGQVLERGESSDFWMGAYTINLVFAELVAVAIAAVLWLTLWPRVSFNVLWGASMVLAVVMPVVFYPFARDLWLAWDLYFRPHEEGDALHR